MKKIIILMLVLSLVFCFQIVASAKSIVSISLLDDMGRNAEDVIAEYNQDPLATLTQVVEENRFFVSKGDAYITYSVKDGKIVKVGKITGFTNKMELFLEFQKENDRVELKIGIPSKMFFDEESPLEIGYSFRDEESGISYGITSRVNKGEYLLFVFAF